ncbi:MAG: hypothetical protein NC412_12230, partial [Roseburia sp.]|nr:hypothetical protein [Roseburia sp.]MCM1279458.1 hypothetical protein [Robinsoniella sp.]
PYAASVYPSLLEKAELLLIFCNRQLFLVKMGKLFFSTVCHKTATEGGEWIGFLVFDGTFP